jgi:hypothetical protein
MASTALSWPNALLSRVLGAMLACWQQSGAPERGGATRPGSVEGPSTPVDPRVTGGDLHGNGVDPLVGAALRPLYSALRKRCAALSSVTERGPTLTGCAPRRTISAGSRSQKSQGPTQGGRQGGREFSLSGSLPCLPALSRAYIGQGGNSLRFPMLRKPPISDGDDTTARLPPSLLPNKQGLTIISIVAGIAVAPELPTTRRQRHARHRSQAHPCHRVPAETATSTVPELHHLRLSHTLGTQAIQLRPQIRQHPVQGGHRRTAPPDTQAR